jgi:hypothetical protein
MKFLKDFVPLSKSMEHGNFDKGELDGRDLKSKISAREHKRLGIKAAHELLQVLQLPICFQQ